MRHLATLLGAVLISTTALAQNWEVLKPSPLAVGITLAQWVIKDQKRVYYVEVVGEGRDLESARQHAFRMAVERAVGTVVASETEAENSRLRRDEIITYAAGYVHDYVVLDQRESGYGIQVQMKVWVSHSAISSRLLNVSRDAGSVEGGRISEQIRSVQHERESADRLLAIVLADYPRRAFDVRLETTRVLITNQRHGELQIPFVLSWNSNYINSLTEVVARINQKSDCNSWFKQCKGTSVITVAGRDTGYFDDTVAYDLMHREMVLSKPQIHVVIRDQFGAVQFRECYSAPELDYANYAPWHYVELGRYRATVNTNSSKRFTIAVDLSKISTKSLDRVDVTVVRRSGC